MNDQHSNNAHLKRGKGKLSGDVKKRNFFLHYKNNAKEKVISQPKYNAFLKELLNEFSTQIVATGLELKLGRVGRIRIKSTKLNFFRKDGRRSFSLKPNWEATWKYWRDKYKVSDEEIVAIEKKILIFHENDHSQQEFYRHFWDKTSSNVKFQVFYNFKASRQYSRLLAKVVKDPNRKVFYYG
jgi:hypothetical protein